MSKQQALFEKALFTYLASPEAMAQIKATLGQALARTREAISLFVISALQSELATLAAAPLPVA